MAAGGPNREVTFESYVRVIAPQSTVTKLRDERYCARGRQAAFELVSLGCLFFRIVGVGTRLKENEDAAKSESERL